MGAIHRYHPDESRGEDSNPVLFDDCDRCREHAEQLVSLDDRNLRELWDRNLDWQATGAAYPLTENERTAMNNLQRVRLIASRLGLDASNG